MRICAFSDLHAILPALRALQAAIKDEALDACWFLGDAVGYGTRPEQVLSALAEWLPTFKSHVWLRGNHDDGLFGLRSGHAYHFTDMQTPSNHWFKFVAMKILMDHHAKLAQNPLPKHFENLKPTCDIGDGIYLAHGTYSDNDEHALWEYATNSHEKVQGQFAGLPSGARLLAVGHYHVPSLYQKLATGVEEIPIRFGETHVFEGISERPILMNVGSVSLPRVVAGKRNCPTYVILELDHAQDRACVSFRRLTFSTETLIGIAGEVDQTIPGIDAAVLAPLRQVNECAKKGEDHA
jgi:predicted phosphodiesterase